MMFMNLLARRWLVGGALIAFVLGSVTACGGGGYVEVGVSAPVFVVQPPPVAPLSFALTRVGPQAIALDWSDNPYVARFVVLRDGYLLATVNAVSLIDAAVYINATHCYQVQGYDNARQLVAASSTGCITVYP
jgi:hypothetical protein